MRPGAPQASAFWLIEMKALYAASPVPYQVAQAA